MHAAGGHRIGKQFRALEVLGQVGVLETWVDISETRSVRTVFKSEINNKMEYFQSYFTFL